jgi:hypothetical protein
MAEDFQSILAPDGTELRFPADMTDEQIAEVMRREYPPQSSDTRTRGTGQIFPGTAPIEMGPKLRPEVREEIARRTEAKGGTGPYGRLRALQEAQTEVYAELPEDEVPMDPRAALTLRAINSALFGLPSANQDFLELVAEAGEDSPLAAGVGDIVGFFAPGTAAAKMGKAALTAATAGRVAGAGRGTQAGIGAAAGIGEGALYEATTGQTTRAAARGEAPSLAGAGREAAEFLTDPMAVGVTALTGGLLGAAAGKARRADGGADETAEEAAAPRGAPTPPPLTQEEAGTLLRRAALGNESARRQLMRRAETNPRVAEIASGLGMDLPFEVLVQSDSMKNILGYLRSQPTSPAEVAWSQQSQNVLRRVEELFNEFNATADLGDLSRRTLDKLQVTKKDLDDLGEGILTNQVRPLVPRDSDIDAQPAIDYIDQIIANAGREGFDALDRDLQRLYTRLTSGDMTYDSLNKERRRIGKQINSFKQNAYLDADDQDVRGLYSVLRQAQMATIEQVAGADVARLADKAFEHLEAGHKIAGLVTQGFGKDAKGSIAQRLQTALGSGAGVSGVARGNDAPLRKLMEIIPEDMQGEALLSGIFSIGRKGGGPSLRISGDDLDEKFVEPFNFTKFSQFMNGLNREQATKNYIFSKLPPGAGEMLDNLTVIANRFREQSEFKRNTGVANNILMQIQAQGMLSQVLQNTAVQSGVLATLGSASGEVAAAAGAALPFLMRSLAKAPKKNVDAVNDFVGTTEFQDLILDVAASPQTRRERIENVMATPEYQRWAKVVGIDNPDTWLISTSAVLAEATNAVREPTDYLYRTPSGPIVDAAGNTYTEEEFDIYQQERQARNQGASQ